MALLIILLSIIVIGLIIGLISVFIHKKTDVNIERTAYVTTIVIVLGVLLTAIIIAISYTTSGSKTENYSTDISEIHFGNENQGNNKFFLVEKVKHPTKTSENRLYPSWDFDYSPWNLNGSDYIPANDFSTESETQDYNEYDSRMYFKRKDKNEGTSISLNNSKDVTVYKTDKKSHVVLHLENKDENSLFKRLIKNGKENKVTGYTIYINKNDMQLTKDDLNKMEKEVDVAVDTTIARSANDIEKEDNEAAINAFNTHATYKKDDYKPYINDSEEK